MIEGKHPQSSPDESLNRLIAVIERVENLPIIHMYENKKRLFLANFVIGIVHGLGTVFGATVVIALVVLILSEFQWIPFIGSFISDILSYIENTR